MEALVCFAFLENLPLGFFFKQSLQCKILKPKLYHCFSPTKKKKHKKIEKKNLNRSLYIRRLLMSPYPYIGSTC